MLTNDAGTIRAGKPQDDLHRLIRDEGLRRYGLFFVTGEGKRLPDGSEDASGYVIDGHGNVFSFWLDWSPEHQAVAFSEWRQVEAEPDWSDSAEYREARRAARLPEE